MLTSALRHLAPLVCLQHGRTCCRSCHAYHLTYMRAQGRMAGVATEVCKLGLCETQARNYAVPAPKQSLEQFVENIRKEIADSYEDLVNKHDAYKQKFSMLVSSSGVPLTSDFSGVVNWTAKTTAIYKEVNYPERVWQLSADKVAAIQALLKNIPAEKKEFAAAKSDDPAPWYLSLTDAQIAEMQKNPRIFRELEKLHSYEEKLRAQIEKDAKDRGVPAVDLAALPAKLDLESEHTFNASEAKWCVDAAKSKASDLIKNDPLVRDPYGSAEFKEMLKKNCEKYGINPAEADAIWQKESKTLGFA